MEPLLKVNYMFYTLILRCLKSHLSSTRPRQVVIPNRRPHRRRHSRLSANTEKVCLSYWFICCLIFHSSLFILFVRFVVYFFNIFLFVRGITQESFAIPLIDIIRLNLTIIPIVYLFFAYFFAHRILFLFTSPTILRLYFCHVFTTSSCITLLVIYCHAIFYFFFGRK